MNGADTSVKVVGFCKVCKSPVSPCDCESCAEGIGPGLMHAELPEGFEDNQHLAEI